MSGADARAGRAVGLGLAALALAWFPGVWLGREVLWTHDLRHHHLPWRAWSAAEWAAGRVPLWCPDVGNGFPLMADGQTGVFYLPTQILFLLLPSTVAVGWSVGLHLIWAGLGAAALARAQGRSVGASWIAGVAWAFSGFMATHTVYLGFQNALAWVPWLLWALHQRRPALAGLCGGALLIAGHPQAAAMGWMLGGVAALAWRRLPILAWAVGIGALIAAPQLVATAELLQFTLRDGGLPDALANAGSLPLLELANGVLPYLFGFERPADIAQTYYHRGTGYWGSGENYWEMAFYLGLPAVVLAVRGGRSRLWVGVALGCALLMLGGPIWSLARHLPLLGGFRFPVRFAMGLTLAVGMLAAEGWDALSGPVEARLGRRVIGGALGVWLAFGAAHLALPALTPALTGVLNARLARPAPPPPELPVLQAAALPPPEVEDPADLPARVDHILHQMSLSTDPLHLRVLQPVLVLLLLGGSLLAPVSRPRRAALVGLVLALDLFAFGRGYTPGTPRRVAEARPAALGWLAGSEARATVVDRRQDPALDTALISASLGLLWGTHDVILPSPLRVVRQEALLQKLGLDVGDRGVVKVARLREHLPLVALLGVRWLLSVHDLGGAPLVRVQDGPVKLYEHPDALPRAFLVSGVEGFPADAALAVWARLDTLDPRTTALVEGAPDLQRPAGGDPGTAWITAEDPQQIQVQVYASSPALLVQTDSWYPGWTATLDGAPAEILRTDFLFRGVEVPPGAHEVVFRYRPTAIRLALLGPPLGLLVALGLWRRRRGAPAQ